MIKEYGIYNNHKLDNTLLVKISDLDINKSTKLDEELEVLYHDADIVGYKISNFIRYAKIKYSGIIYLPADPLIDVINSILANHHLETLMYKKGSGYITKKNGNSMGVFVIPGTFLRDGDISKGRFASYYDLYIDNENDKELFEINEDILEGIDFFKAEVH